MAEAASPLLKGTGGREAIDHLAREHENMRAALATSLEFGAVDVGLRICVALAGYWRARGWQVVFGGGPGDLTALEPARAEGFTVLAGQPRMTAAGLIKLSTVVVGGDTGFLHLAVD